MPDLSWLSLLLFAALLAFIFTAGSAQTRRYLFVTQCMMGAVVGLYGFWKLSVDQQYFKTLGLPLSLIVVISLCFAILTVERVFSPTVLNKRAYSILCVYLACWISIALLTAVWKRSSSYLPLWNGIFPVVMIAAFISAALSRFRLALFQIFLPVLFVLFVLTSVESYAMAVFGAVSESVKMGLEQSTTAFTKLFLEGNVWGLFHLFAYLYLCTRANKRLLKQNLFADKLPLAGVILAVSSFLSQFPEFETFRKLLPMQPSFADNGLLSLDLLLIPLFLCSSGWPYDRRNLIITVAVLVPFLTCTVALSVSYSNPFGTTPDTATLRKVEKTASVVTSKPANGGHVKTGQRIKPETRLFYLFAS